MYPVAKNPLVIYHANCMDGVFAAWCFWDKFKDADFVEGVYQEAPPDVKGRDVYLVDFSYPRIIVEKMISEAFRVTLIDHHKTAIEDLKDVTGLRTYTDLNRSGAVLAWDFLNPGQSSPKLLKHVQDRDLWRFELDRSREIHAYLTCLTLDFPKIDQLVNLSPLFYLDQAKTMGAVILQKQRKDIDELITQNRRMLCIAQHLVPVVNAPWHMASEMGNLLAQGHPFAATYYDTEKARVFALRSSERGEDVSAIAKQYGGGGHPRAAGFKVPRDHPLARA